MRTERMDGSGRGVAGEADFKCDAAAREFGKQFGIRDGGDAVSDAAGAEFHARADAGGTGGFPRVRDKREPVVANELEGRGEHLGRSGALVATNPEGHHAIAGALNSEARHFVDVLHTEVANGVQHEPGIERGARAFLGNCVIYGGEVEFLPQRDAGGQREFDVADILRGQFLEVAPGGEGVVIG